MDGAADDLSVLGEDGLHVGLGDQQGVEVADEDAGVEGARVRLVGHVAAGHQARGGGRRPIHCVCARVGGGLPACVTLLERRGSSTNYETWDSMTSTTPPKSLFVFLWIYGKPKKCLKREGGGR